MSSSESLDFSKINDPYERFLAQDKYKNNLIYVDKSTKFSKKLNKFKNAMIAAKSNMINGAMMGFMVGGLFGFVVGCYSAFQTKRLLTIPLSVIISGGSFGFILGCGSVIRSDTIIQYKQTNCEQIETIDQLVEGQWKNIVKTNEIISQNKGELL